MIKDIMITSLETITAFDTSGNYLYTLDELQNATIAQSEEKSEITGKSGRRLGGLKKNKAVTISGTNGIISGGLLESQTGSQFVEGATKVMWTDFLTVDENHEASTTYTAVGTTGAEIVACYTKDENGLLDTKLVQDSAAAAGKFAYAPATKKLSFHTDIAKGTEIMVCYERNISASKLVNSSDKMSGKCQMYIDALGEDKCSNVYRVQFYIPRCDFSGEFSLEMGGDQTVHAFSADALASDCAGKKQFFTYTVFGANAEDATA